MADLVFRTPGNPRVPLHPRLQAIEAAVLVIVPLLVGGMIYLGFRTDQLLMFAAAERLGLGGHIEVFREGVAPLRPRLRDWMVFSLPNALWTLSFVSFFGLLWRHEPWTAARWMAATSMIAVAPELLQAANLFPGTFSGEDLATGILACTTAALSVHLLPFIFSRQ